MSNDKSRVVMRSSRVYDKTRPEGKQDVAIIEGAIGEDGSAAVLFGCQSDGKVCWLSKQHAVEFASSMLMIALSLPGDIPAGDMSMDAKDWPKEGGE
jgi:hypothetical protein